VQERFWIHARYGLDWQKERREEKRRKGEEEEEVTNRERGGRRWVTDLQELLEVVWCEKTPSKFTL
jgi:hypothetical protein